MSNWPLTSLRYITSINLPLILFLTIFSTNAVAPDVAPVTCCPKKVKALSDCEHSKYCGIFHIPSDGLRISTDGS